MKYNWDDCLLLPVGEIPDPVVTVVRYCHGYGIFLWVFMSAWADLKFEGDKSFNNTASLQLTVALFDNLLILQQSNKAV